MAFYENGEKLKVSNIVSQGFEDKMRVFMLISYLLLLFAITFVANFYNYCVKNFDRNSFKCFEVSKNK